MKKLFLRVGRLWLAGLVLFSLRLVQNRTGFDPATGLALPSTAGNALVVLLLICIAAEAVLCLRLPRKKAAFANQFAPPERGTPIAVAASLLLAAGSALLLVSALPERNIAAIAAGALGVASGLGLLLLTKQMRAGVPLCAAPVLPFLFFAVFFVLTVYIPVENDPVLARFYLPVLASALMAYAFSHLGGFLRKEGNVRWFVLTADLAVPLCVAAIADGGGAGRMLIFAGCALLLSVFLTLRRDAALPEEDMEM